MQVLDKLITIVFSNDHIIRQYRVHNNNSHYEIITLSLK